MFSAAYLHNQRADRGRAGERDFGNAGAGGECFACFYAETVDDVQYACWQQVSNQFHHDQNGGRGLFGGFQYHAVACCQCRCAVSSTPSAAGSSTE